MLVGVGGASGCLARFLLEQAWGGWHTVVVGQAFANVTGALALGLLTAWSARTRSPHRRRISLLLGTGLLGGWTTYSGLALQTLTTAEGVGVPAGLLVLLGSVVAGVLAAAAGVRLGSRRAEPAVER